MSLLDKSVSAAASIARHGLAVMVSCIGFSSLFGIIISFNKKSAANIPIDTFLIFIFVLPVVVFMGLPLRWIFSRINRLAGKAINSAISFSLALTAPFFAVTFMSRTTDAHTGRLWYVFWAYEVGTTTQFVGITCLVAIASAGCGILYWKIAGGRSN